MGELSDFDRGLLAGLLVGQGHFGGDGRQPQVTLRMHVRHETLLRWLHGRFPRTRLYGPYHHGGRHYFQWMARGEALVEDLLPVLERHIGPDLQYIRINGTVVGALAGLGIALLTQFLH